MSNISPKSESHGRLNDLLAEIIELPSDEQEQRCRQACTQFPELAEELESFLADHRLMLSLSEEEEGEFPEDSEPTLPPEPPDDDLTLAPSADACEQTTLAGRFGNYQLLGEIARGGMGVVYKAQQIKPKRLVALKMILSGQFASENDVQRFYAEAESAADLDHPGIVPIYEAGEHQGRHYFAMKYVQGESLAQRMSKRQFSCHEAAALVKKVADAIADAHRHGVIHRDLKPGNILLDETGEPRVTDFGLAKRIGSESGLTVSGQIMGTPSYMPPEQAAGKLAQIDERSDIYSLGAILYAMLTGRPPFHAENPLDTLIQVLESEPTMPRLLRRGLPGDLELICMRCLEKRPSDRYSAAADLANDLERFLKEEPVEARPGSLVRQVRRWARREPALASHIAALVFAAGIVTITFLLIGAAPMYYLKHMMVLGGWALCSTVFQRLLDRPSTENIARFAWTTADCLFLTTSLYLAENELGLLLIAYALLVATSGLFVRVRLVIYTTCVAVGCFVGLLTLRPDAAEPFHYAALFAAMLGVLGGVVAYQTHRLRALSHYYEGRRL